MKSSTIVIDVTKSKNQNYVPNIIFFTILNSNQDLSSNFNKVKNHETKTENENTYQTGP